MRYEKGHGETTRQRIVDVASKRFREGGFAAVGLTTVMKEVGLTNGGFYLHFESKEALVREALNRALDDRQAAFEALLAHDPANAVEMGLRMYLSATHRDDPSGGCPSAALLAEVARHSNETRAAYEERFESFVSLLKRMMPDRDPEDVRQLAPALFGLLIGTMQLARAVATPALSDEILESGIQAALKLARAAD